MQVTGSRIFRTGFDTLEPATVVTRERIEQRRITNIADALNELPGFGTAITPEGGQSGLGVGVNFVGRLAVTNLTDEEPPFPLTGIAAYDILGKRYALSAIYKF